jgi:hypothetical protein
LPNPSNGRVTQQGNRPGARATYVCTSGYELVGLSSRICQNNGQWSGDAPVCESKSMQMMCLRRELKDFLSNLQSAALIFPIHLMGGLTSEVMSQEIELATSATAVMSLLVYLQESVRTTDSGLEMHPLVKVSDCA